MMNAGLRPRVTNRVAYSVHNYNLTAAGQDIIEQFQGVLRFHAALDINGVLQPQASINVRLGVGNDDPFPLSIGQAIYADATIRAKLEWAAQSGIVRAVLILSSDRRVFDLDSTPPVLQVAGPQGSTINTSAVTVNAAATLLVAANANRKGLAIQNAGGNPWFIGPAGVTTTNGFRLDPGAVWETEVSSAAIYGIAAAAGELARVLELTA